MEELKNAAWVWLSILMVIQSGVFLWSANDGKPIVQSYLAAWATTLRSMMNVFVPGKSAAEKNEPLIAWVITLLSLPGAIFVMYAAGRMAQ